MLHGSVELLFSALLLVLGFAFLIKGADWLVSGASALAKYLGMSDLMIGLTIVAFGTSMPELLVNIIASFQGNADIAIGNIIGSNIANTLLVLGASATIAPLVVRTSTVWKEIPFSLLAALVLYIVVNDTVIDGSMTTSQITRSEGMILMCFFLIFVYYTFGLKNEEGIHVHTHHMSTLRAIGLVLLGCIALPIGGKLVVDSSSTIAMGFGVSEAMVGLSLVALGTSLPEVVTACVAVYRGRMDIAVGNVVGSNIFNIFWILGLSAIIRPLPFSPLMNMDLLLVVVSSVILFTLVHKGSLAQRIAFWRRREQYALLKHEGMLLLLGYVGYLVYIGIRG